MPFDSRRHRLEQVGTRLDKGPLSPSRRALYMGVRYHRGPDSTRNADGIGTEIPLWASSCPKPGHRRAIDS